LKTSSDVWAAKAVESESWRIAVIKVLLWFILFVLCWPLAVLALVLYPLIWLVLLPFRLLGIVVAGVLEVVWTVVTLPAVLLRKLTAR
jgi:hypothetical protein